MMIESVVWTSGPVCVASQLWAIDLHGLDGGLWGMYFLVETSHYSHGELPPIDMYYSVDIWSLSWMSANSVGNSSFCR